jgi:hypothetical protein
MSVRESVPMKRKIRATPLPQTFGWVLLILSFAGLFGRTAHAQDIRIKVLNGRSGKPITNECLNVWIPNFYGAHIVARTNKRGTVILHVTESAFSGEVRCGGWPVAAARPKDGETITVSGDNYVACQEYGNTLPADAANRGVLKQLMPSYSISRIADSGLSSSNTCGKFRAKAKPGELIFFVRPRSFFEKMRE